MSEPRYGRTGTAFIELGGRAGPVLLLAGSLGSDRTMWAGWAERMSEDRRVILVEWPGHGQGRIDGPFSVDDLAADVRDHVQELGIEDVSYCGLSLGGAVGQVLLARSPGLFRDVVLVACGLTFATQQALVERSAAVCRGGLPALAEASLRRWFAEPGRGAAQELRHQHVAHLLQMEPLGYALCCLALAGWDGAAYEHARRHRVLVVGGAQDAAVPVADVRRVAEVVGAERCVIVDDAGHLVNVDQPERFEEVVGGFLRQTG